MNHSIRLNKPLKRRFILISVDALNKQFINQMKFLNWMMQNGIYSLEVHSTSPSITYPAHVSMITGEQPATHGIIGNIPFNINKLIEHTSMCEGEWFHYNKINVPTIFEILAKKGLIVANCGWPVTHGLNYSNYDIKHSDQLNLLNYVYVCHDAEYYDHNKYLEVLGETGKTLERELNINLISGDSMEADEQKYLIAEHFLTKNKDINFLALYFASIDYHLHKYGCKNVNIQSKLKKIDNLIKKLYDIIHEDVEYDNYLMVVSDHGMIDINKGINLNILFRKENLLNLDKNNQVESFDAFSYHRGGMVSIIINSSLSEKERKSVKMKVIKILENQKSLGRIDTIIDLEEIKNRNKYSSSGLIIYGTEILVSASYGYTFYDMKDIEKDSEIVNCCKGMHGYLPKNNYDDPMNGIFCMVGPDIPKNINVGTMNVRDYFNIILNVNCPI